MEALNHDGERTNTVHVDRSSLRDAETALEAIAMDMNALIDRIKAAADDNGCVYEQLTEAAEQLEWVKADTVGSPLKWIKDRLFWWEHDQ